MTHKLCYLFFCAALLLLNPQAGCVTPNGAISVPLSRNIATGERFMGIRLLGTLRLPNDAVDGLKLSGISALAWDEDEGLLYALSDRGWVFHLQPIIEDNLLIDVKRLGAYPLQDRQGNALVTPWRDSEGLTLNQGANGRRGDSELWVSFEVKQRVSRYTPHGRYLGRITLPIDLQDSWRFRNSNKSLEAITLHPTWGLLLAPEQPLRTTAQHVVTIYAGDQHRWRYPLYPTRGSALVAFEALADGSLLTLERAFVSLARPLVISLRRVWLSATETQKQGELAVENVAIFDTSKGWLLDNFEGLTQHRYGRFFIISDDNTNFLQSTLLVYFELIEAPIQNLGLPKRH